MKNLWVIPTDNPSRLWKNYLLQDKLELCKEVLPFSTAQHIYIISDEETKDGEWVMSLYTDTPQKISKSDFLDEEYYKKIIITTDQDLIKDGVQAIDDEFLEWFVKNPSCEEIEVKPYHILYHLMSKTPLIGYRIIIPKEEPKQNLPGIDGETFKVVLDREWFPKQETIEEAAEIYSFGWGENDDEKAFIEGAKWQAEQMEKLKDFDTWKEWKNETFS